MPLQKRSDLILKEVENETLILNAKGDKIHHLNETATFVWNYWDGNRSSADIAKMLSKHFDVRPETARQDVDQIVTQFKELTLFVETDSDCL